MGIRPAVECGREPQQHDPGKGNPSAPVHDWVRNLRPTVILCREGRHHENHGSDSNFPEFSDFATEFEYQPKKCGPATDP